jgi:hypothetical protein
MVHHIRSIGKSFVAADNSDTNNKEHMFAFIEGITSEQTGHLLLGILNRWQNDPTARADQGAAITPRLVTAAVLAYHGYVVARVITNAFDDLEQLDIDLESAVKEVEDKTESIRATSTENIHLLNQNLIKINRNLTRTRSTMHFLAESADLLVNGITPFDKYVTERSKDLDDSFHLLDSFKERIRDHDKLTMVSKSMLQHKTDIESIQRHIGINVDMVSAFQP